MTPPGLPRPPRPVSAPGCRRQPEPGPRAPCRSREAPSAGANSPARHPAAGEAPPGPRHRAAPPRPAEPRRPPRSRVTDRCALQPPRAHQLAGGPGHEPQVGAGASPAALRCSAPPQRPPPRGGAPAMAALILRPPRRLPPPAPPRPRATLGGTSATQRPLLSSIGQYSYHSPRAVRAPPPTSSRISGLGPGAPVEGGRASQSEVMRRGRVWSAELSTAFQVR